MKNKILVISAFAIIIGTSNAIAQGINSPYSRYGFGMMSDRAMGFNKGMGGVALGFHDGKQVNVANPASYASVDSLSALFDVGMSIQNGNFKMGNLQQNARNANFEYFAFQFRAAPHLGVTLGVLPVSNINYSFDSSSQELNENEDYTSSYAFDGNGGLHQVMLGIGWRPFKPFAFGVNGSFLWGEYSHTMDLSFNQTSVYTMERAYSANINSYTVDFGMQLDFPINKKDKLTLGATYGLGHKISNRAYRATNTVSTSSSSSVILAQTVDTIKNAFDWPHSFGVGLTYYHNDQLRAGVDFTMQKWSEARFPSQDMSTTTGEYVSTKGQLNDQWKVAAGLDYVPNKNGMKMSQHITYRVGGYYSKSYAKADITNTISSEPTEFGLSAGIGIPISNKNIWHNAPTINISAQWVHCNIPYLSATTLQKATLKENYLKLCVGLTFNERWFYKWKVQ